MKFRKDIALPEQKKKKFYSKTWFKIFLALAAIALGIAGAFAYKTGSVLNKISGNQSSAISSLMGSAADLQEQEGRTNILLLGMRGQNVPGGGLLADSVIVVSLDTKNNRVALISIPRDLYVKIPGTENRGKLNSVYATWQSNGKNEGIPRMEEMVGTITGLKMNYAIVINHEGFKKLIDAVGGIDVTLKKPFYESKQFVEGNECGGNFTLPGGTNHLNGEKALCYARARENTSDFDRSKRQQLILKTLKDKLLSLGTLTDFSKVNGILNTIGDNVKTDLAPDEMKGLFGEMSNMKDAQIVQRVFENSEAGLLMVPSIEGAGYILVPRAGQDNYSQLQEASRNIFTQEKQKDTDPAVQNAAPVQTDSSDKSDSKKKSSSDKEKK